MVSSHRTWLTHEREIAALVLVAALPGLLLAMALLWAGDFAPRTRWVLSFLTVGGCAAMAALVRQRVAHPLRTVSNVLGALREGDFSLRASGAGAPDSLGLLLLELNNLGSDLRAQRLGALEATALLRRVMEEIDVSVFAFDETQAIRLVNRAGAAMLGRPPEQLLGRRAGELGLAMCLSPETPLVADLSFPGAQGRFAVRSGTFRQGGLPHTLLVLADMSHPLSDAERQAWRRLIRVLGHELNNSLAPIKSLAQSLADLVERDPRPVDWREDVQNGLRVIGSRAESLSRLMASYAQLARLPHPKLERVSVSDWVRRVAALETRRAVKVSPGPDVTVVADGAQLDQLLINLIRNAVDASTETDGEVEVHWSAQNGRLEVSVRDRGLGLADPTNVFVPFFTTKPNGSGIGLALSRQIAEAHRGTLALTNRRDGGCEARLSLPVAGAQGVETPLNGTGPD
jgi:two-component system, NtrC family, nitrogen regulation sensor histidine kinase NtrY